MKIGKVEVHLETQVGVYNCAMGVISSLMISSSTGGHVDPTLLHPHMKELANEFFEFLKDPTKINGGCQKASPFGWGNYNKLAFFVFHDNIKSQGNKLNPLYDMSSWLEWLSRHEKELGCRVIKTPMVDNLHHPPSGSHPGRVMVLIPPYAQVYESGSAISEDHRLGLQHVLSHSAGLYGNKLIPEDVAVLKKLTA